MVDSIVSVRMPSSLVQKLKELSSQNHFMDVSEELRSVIRAKTNQYRVKIGQPMTKPSEKAPGKDYRTENVVREELVKKLKDMIKELEHEE